MVHQMPNMKNLNLKNFFLHISLKIFKNFKEHLILNYQIILKKVQFT